MISFDPTLVILSAAIAIIGAFTAGVMTSNIVALKPGEGQSRIIMAALSLGGAIWAMHFVGLLSMEAPVNWSRNPGFIAASATIALLGTSLALFIFRALDQEEGMGLLLASAILGIAIATTNYLGLGAAAGRGLRLSWFLTLMDVAVSIQAASILLWFLFRPRGVALTLAGSVFLGLALASTHFLAVYSAQGLDQTLALIPPTNTGISDRYLAWSATIIMYLICSICLCIYFIMQYQDEMEE